MVRFLYIVLFCCSLLVLTFAGCDNQDRQMNKEAAGEIAALQHRLAGLQTEVERLEDVKAIKILQRAYGYYVDQAAWDEVADLFTDDASVELAKGGVYQGKDRIREFFYKLGNDKTGLTEGQLNEHIQLQPVVHVSADGMTAKARWRALILAGQYGERAVWGEGPYENEYRKEDGIWKISKLHWYQTFIVPYAGGWGANTDVTGGRVVEDVLPPDQPPTENYDVWPGVYVPPFHYHNPVSGR
jgi:ketosteroid isomerase-like protein